MQEPSAIRKIAFLGDYLPRKCGIATFTTDLRCSVAGIFQSEVAGMFADGDAASTVIELEQLRNKHPAFFHENASDVVELRKLCGAGRCDSCLVRADASANILIKQAKLAQQEMANVSFGNRDVSYATAGTGRRGRGQSLVMMADSK